MTPGRASRPNAGQTKQNKMPTDHSTTPAPFDILAKLAARQAAQAAQVFPIRTKVYSSAHRTNAIGARQTDAKEARVRRMRARMVRPENAAAVAAAMPAQGDSAHAILAGDFVFCDLLPAVCALPGIGQIRRLEIATLSLSLKNIETIAAMVEPGRVPFHLVLSHHFRGTNKLIYEKAAERLKAIPSARLTVARTHCKVAIMEFDAAAFVMEASANLRTSQNLEQLTIFNDAGLAEFHRGWMEELAALPPPQ
jgi:hypothetical protein